MQLQSYVSGKWQAGTRNFVTLRDATTNEVIASASAEGIDFRAMLWNARHVGGKNLRELTFHERAGLLKSVAKMLSEYKDEFYRLSYMPGAPRATRGWTSTVASVPCSCMPVRVPASYPTVASMLTG